MMGGNCSGQGATLGAYLTTVTGTRQSPIDIRTQDCVSVTDRQSIYFDYPESIFNVPIQNNGYGWIVNIPTEMSKQTAVEQGPLDGKYLLEQFHAHWGGDCSCGSEHTVDGKSYAAELHLVHWNSSRFASFAEAVSQDRGLAVVGVFLDVSAEPHPEFEKICSRMKGIQFKDDVVNISEPMSLHSLLPSDKCYWSYEGSLTTPPFSESVTWIVLKEPIQVSEKQLEALRSICQHTKDDTPSEGDGRIVKNFRPTQAICNRTITFDRNAS